jgi:hypothetical protein
MDSLRVMAESQGDVAWAVAEIERLRAVLDKVGNHRTACGTGPCQWFRAARSALAPLVQEKP